MARNQFIINTSNHNFGSGNQWNFAKVTGSTNFGYSGSTSGMTKIPPSSGSISVKGNIYEKDDSWFTDGSFTVG